MWKKIEKLILKIPNILCRLEKLEENSNNSITPNLQQVTEKGKITNIGLTVIDKVKPKEINTDISSNRIVVQSKDGESIIDSRGNIYLTDKGDNIVSLSPNEILMEDMNYNSSVRVEIDRFEFNSDATGRYSEYSSQRLLFMDNNVGKISQYSAKGLNLGVNSNEFFVDISKTTKRVGGSDKVRDDFNEWLEKSKNLDTIIGIIYVNKNSIEKKENGSISYPYKTIQAGIDAASSNNIVIISYDEYIENISINKDLIIQGNETKITGNVEIVSPTSNVLLYSLEISGTYYVTSNDIDVNANYITVIGMTNFDSEGGTQKYSNCFFSDTRQNGANTIEIIDSRFSKSYTLIINNKDATMILTRVDDLSVRDQYSKLIHVRDCNFINYSGFGFISNPSSNQGVVFFESANFYQSETNTYAKLNRIGQSKTFVLGNIIIDKGSTAPLLNGQNVIKLIPYWYEQPNDTGWVDITLNPDYTKDIPVQYRRIGTKVTLRGKINLPTDTPSTHIYFTLPAGFRPPNLFTTPMAGVDTGAGDNLRVIINKDGDVYSAGSVYGWVSLDGIEFYIE